MRMLSEKFSNSPLINKYNSPQFSESDTMVYSFSELEEIFDKFNNAILPQLLKGDLSRDELETIIFDLREDFNMILYQIQSTNTFRDIFERYL